LVWLLKAAVFFAVFAFALNNQAVVRLHFFFGTYWEAPLVLVLLAVTIVGVLLGVLIMLPLWLAAKKQAAPPRSTTTPPHGL
jgi:lipopolysaccharide assembly protein A